ncbi:MAG: helicase-related protein, partial [Hoeflea sp.]|nr:helicase-related protein [Hoeflea sp.]
TVNHLTARFSNRGFSVVALSGELSQNERTHALQALRDGRAKVCVATDVAARGLDLPDLELVIHADLPKNPESLLHRSGRTGRAGRKGVSALIVPYNARRRTERLLADARIAANWARPPSSDEILARDDERLMADASFVADVAEDEAAMVAALLERHGADKVAAALVRLHRAGRSSPEELIDDGPVSAPGAAAGGTYVERAPREHVAIKGAVWFSLSLGRKQSAEPRWLLPMICRAGHITKTEIGSIRIHDLETHVEIAGVAADKFEAAIGPTRKIEKNVTVTRLAGVPEAPARTQRPLRSQDEDVASAPRDDQAPRADRPERSDDDYRPREKAKPDYAKKRPFTGGKKRDDRPPRQDAYADRKPGAYADKKPSARHDAPAPAKTGGWPYDDAPPAAKFEKPRPEPAPERPAKPAKAAVADPGADRPFAKDKKPFDKDKKPKRDKPGFKGDFKPDFKAGAKPAKPHRKGEKNPLADVTKRVTADGGKGGLKRKPKE